MASTHTLQFSAFLCALLMVTIQTSEGLNKEALMKLQYILETEKEIVSENSSADVEHNQWYFRLKSLYTATQTDFDSTISSYQKFVRARAERRKIIRQLLNHIKILRKISNLTEDWKSRLDYHIEELQTNLFDGNVQEMENVINEAFRTVKELKMLTTESTLPTAPITKPTLIAKPTTERILTINPITKPTLITKPTTERILTINPITKPTLITNPTTERILTINPITKPTLITKPTTERILTINPITKPTLTTTASTNGTSTDSFNDIMGNFSEKFKNSIKNGIAPISETMGIKDLEILFQALLSNVSKYIWEILQYDIGGTTWNLTSSTSVNEAMDKFLHDFEENLNKAIALIAPGIPSADLVKFCQYLEILVENTVLKFRLSIQTKPTTVIPTTKPTTVIPTTKPTTVIPTTKPTTVIPKTKPTTVIPTTKPTTPIQTLPPPQPTLISKYELDKIVQKIRANAATIVSLLSYS